MHIMSWSAAKEEAALLKPACANIGIVNIEFYEWLALKETKIMFPVISFEEIRITNPNCCTASNRQPSIRQYHSVALLLLLVHWLDIVSVNNNSKGSCA